MNDSPLDRAHGRKELLTAVAADEVGRFAGLLSELLDTTLLELLAIDLDILLELPSDERLVRQYLHGVEELTVTIDHSPGVTTVQPDDDLCLVFLGSSDEIEARALQ